MIKTSVVFNDIADGFAAKHAVFSDMLLGLMAAAIETRIKTGGITPFKTGGLRSSVRHRKVGVAAYEVTADKEYAAAQEAGTTRGHEIKNYTTPDTNKGWFQDAIDTVRRDEKHYVEVSQKSTGIRGSI
jgi:hypothetical protein